MGDKKEKEGDDVCVACGDGFDSAEELEEYMKDKE